MLSDTINNLHSLVDGRYLQVLIADVSYQVWVVRAKMKTCVSMRVNEAQLDLQSGFHLI